MHGAGEMEASEKRVYGIVSGATLAVSDHRVYAVAKLRAALRPCSVGVWANQCNIRDALYRMRVANYDP